MKRKKKQKKIDIKRSWGVPEKTKLRYQTPIEKGIYWWYFSRMIRRRDFEKYGTCISCGKRIDDWETAHCGHYIAASKCGITLLFNHLNNNMECAGCNLLDESHTVGYRINLVARYGEDAVNALETQFYANRSILQPQWKADTYIELLRGMGIERIVDTNEE